jgi:NAD(P)-dependent dehydrogenase (short-subunit alcohol dehydrogenase family)
LCEAGGRWSRNDCQQSFFFDILAADHEEEGVSDRPNPGSDAPIALVTGARRGIGQAAALALAASGFDVVVNDLEGDDAGETLAGIRAAGRRGALAPGDIADLAAQEDLAARAWEAFGRIDCLVNNAGVSVMSRGDLLDVTVESYDRCLDVNLRGPFFLTQKIARRMLAAAPGPHHRSIVTISSISAEVVSINRGEYCISKAGLSMLSKLFAVRLAEAGIGVYEVRPGIIRTDMTAVAAPRLDALINEGYTPIRRWGEPADVGRAVASLATGALPFSVGQIVYTDGGLAVPRF